jgi:outer membrane protein
MRRIKTNYCSISVLLLLLFISPVKSFSQNVKVLNLQDAISLAEKNNSELIVAKMDRLKADEKVSQVYSENLVPTLSLSSSYQRYFKKPIFNITFLGLTESVPIGADNTITTTLNVSEPIPILGTPVFSGIKIAQVYSKLQKENVKSVETKIKADVTKAFINVVLLKEVIEVNKQSFDNAQENLRVVEVRYKTGTATEFDYLRAKVKVETLLPAISQSENNLSISKKVFKTTIGLKTDDELDAAGKLTYDSNEVYGKIEDIIRKISNENVAVRQLSLSNQINEELIRVDRSSFLPKIYLFGQYNLQAQEDDGKSFFRYFFNNAILAGIGLSWNLNFFANNYKVNQSEIEVKKTNEQILNVKDQLKTQTQSVLLRLDDAKKRIVAQKQNENLAERGLELANTYFKSGVINQIDVLDAELSVSQVKLALLQAVYDYLNARTELEQLLEK